MICSGFQPCAPRNTGSLEGSREGKREAGGGGTTATWRGSPYTGPTPHPTHLGQSQGGADQTVRAFETFPGIPRAPHCSLAHRTHVPFFLISLSEFEAPQSGSKTRRPSWRPSIACSLHLYPCPFPPLPYFCLQASHTPPPPPHTVLNLGDSYCKLGVQTALPEPGPLGAPCKAALQLSTEP